ncbi:MAG TPA: hypothetical protein VG675_08040 [Bryobacteraceae bacterium]|nr:hypothetical protein [Bryobacteraceae bacterium]
MENPRPQFALRLLPSMTDFAFLMPIVFLFARMDGARTLLSDGDTGWHIRTGQWILAHHRVPAHDIFSFSRAGDVWYAWEWLWDVLFAWLYMHGGLAIVVLASMLVISFTYTLLFRLVRRRASSIVAIIFMMLAAVSSSIHWLARPHLFTLLFLVLFYGALENVRAGRTRMFGRVPYLWVLPFATILWTNLHGGFFAGILLVGTYGVGELLRAVFAAESEERRTAARCAWHYVCCAAGCLAASLVNPYTYHLHVHVVDYLADPYQGQHIVEFFSLSFHHPMAIFFEAVIVAATMASFWYISKRQFIEPLVMLMWMHAALVSARNIPIFTLLAAPMAAGAVEEWLKLLPQLQIAAWARSAAKSFRQVAAELDEIDVVRRWHVVSACAVVLVGSILFAPAPPRKFRSDYDPKSYPAAALAVLDRDPHSRIFTSDEWGDYLIYRLYPQTKVFVDGRSDFYGRDFEEKYLAVMNVKYNWEKTLDGFGIDTILLPTDAPLAGALKESSRWRLIYDDGISLVFRPSRANPGTQFSANPTGGGTGRDREVTKTEARDRTITESKSKT